MAEVPRRMEAMEAVNGQLGATPTSGLGVLGFRASALEVVRVVDPEAAQNLPPMQEALFSQIGVHVPKKSGVVLPDATSHGRMDPN